MFILYKIKLSNKPHNINLKKKNRGQCVPNLIYKCLNAYMYRKWLINRYICT